MMFRCVECRARRSMAVAPHLRMRKVRCQKCGVITICNLNRRYEQREFLSGKVILLTSDGKELEIDLHDISSGGVGFELPFMVARKCKLNVGEKVRFKCRWNASRLERGEFVIKEIKGQRVGVQKVR